MRPELFKIPGLNFAVPSYGAMVVVAFLFGTWWMTRRASRVKADPDVCLSLALICLIFGWIGGRTFYVIHYWHSQFALQPSKILDLQAGGFEVYGGLILGALVCVIYIWLKRLSLRLYADLAAPSILFGMGVGRIGCFLVGCCWGAACPANLPWAVTFPASSPALMQQWQDRLVVLPAQLIFLLPEGTLETVAAPVWALAPKPGGCGAKHAKQPQPDDIASAEASLNALQAQIERQTRANSLERARAERDLRVGRALIDHFRTFDLTPGQLQGMLSSGGFRSAPVHPAQLYSAIGPLLLALLTSTYFYRRRRHGTVMALAVIFYAVERFIEETLRMDNPLDTFGLTVSQGISVAFLVVGVGWLALLHTMPARSAWPARKPPPATTDAVQPAAAP